MIALLKEHSRPIGAGIAGAATMTLFWLATRLLLGWGTPSELCLDRMAPFINAHLSGVLIGIFGGYTHLKVLSFLSVAVGQLLVGIAGAVIYSIAQARMDRRAALALSNAGLLVALYRKAILL